ncbi:CocE/NonD family hydrolase [Pelomonas sp. Root1444]|uniref:CocE/NonD family hydrolase n=1 Tax=Pelomonas sp. Root1444 TaxID=1736464 RepID=UPI0007035998|nr:CocE/NonD family hydrolase [Pelomonas sp. Root1444]KQY88799.1 X-Pro dipeptidyl-peptidase [Pelomonas sp. Root1444]
MLLRASFLLLLALAGASARAAEEDKPPAYEPREHYTKYEYRVPVRDGARLFTAVYLPKDQSRRYPLLMVRTPYGCGPYGVDRDGVRALAPSEDFLKAGYIFVCQDVRGRSLSEGEFIEMTPHRPVKKTPTDVDESSDTHDSVQWLLDRIPGHNGRVGLWGISYPGFYTAASIIDSHPAIKAASPQAPIADLFMGDDSYHGGAFMLAANFGFYTGFKPQQGPTPPPKQWPQFDWGTLDGYEFHLDHGNLDALSKRLAKDGGANPYFDVQLAHDRYDEFWQSRAITPHLKHIRAAVLTVGGWFDAEDLAGPLAIFRAIGRHSPATDNRLVMGPWVHGGWVGAPGRQLGRVQFQQPTAEQFQKEVLLPFFEQHLRGEPDAKAPRVAKATVFETGTNVWRRYDAWPPREAQPRTLYFAPGGKLSFTPPQPTGPEFDSWVSDPAKPVPYIGYASLGVPQEYMVSDQRFASTRPDVLTFRSDVLEEDVTLAGPVVARLFASTTGTDADWVVKLIDVYPPELEDEVAKKRKPRTEDVEPQDSPLGGYQQLVRGDPLRGRFRKGFEAPEAMVPGQVEELRVALQDINHSFRRGHRIMVQVQSSWFPLIDRNPQTFVPIRSARPEDFQAATQKLFRWAGQASGLEVKVLAAPPR